MGHVGLAGVQSLWGEGEYNRTLAVISQALWSACCVRHPAISVRSTVSPILQMGILRLRKATLLALSHTAEIGTQVCLLPKP